MATSFGDLWNRVLLFAPGVPTMIAQRMVRNVYDRILARHEWSELYNDGEKVVDAEVTLGKSTGIANGATTITCDSGTVTTDMVGKNALLGNSTQVNAYSPRMYDIIAVNTGTNTITLETGWQGKTTTAAVFVKVGEYMVRFPSDLKTLDDVRDKRNNWRLRRMFHQQNYIDLIDPKRTHTGFPILYAGCRPITLSGVEYPRYEFWPRLSGETPLVFRYVKRTDFTTNTDTIPDMILPEAIIYGVLSELCIWPGSTEKPNPYFNLDLHAKYVTMFEDALQSSIMNDTNRSQRMLLYEDTATGYPVDASFWQAHGIVPR